jgi:hypothetical protein
MDIKPGTEPPGVRHFIFRKLLRAASECASRFTAEAGSGRSAPGSELTPGRREMEAVATNDLRGLRYLPPAGGCMALPFFYS